MKAKLKHPHGPFDAETYYYVESIDYTGSTGKFTLANGREKLEVLPDGLNPCDINAFRLGQVVHQQDLDLVPAKAESRDGTWGFAFILSV